MHTLTILAIASTFLAGCVAYPTEFDGNFGQAVTCARAQQVVNPDASLRRHLTIKTDGQAAKSSIDRYQKSFETPAPPVNVFNIGVGSGS